MKAFIHSCNGNLLVTELLYGGKYLEWQHDMGVARRARLWRITKGDACVFVEAYPEVAPGGFAEPRVEPSPNTPA